MFTLDDVDVAFDKIVQLKYSQTIHLKGMHLYNYILGTKLKNLREEFIGSYMYFCLIGKGHGLQITPLPAGHMLGGTIWKIIKDGEEEIVYAVDYNHKKER